MYKWWYCIGFMLERSTNLSMLVKDYFLFFPRDGDLALCRRSVNLSTHIQTALTMGTVLAKKNKKNTHYQRQSNVPQKMTAWPDFGATHGETAHWRVEMSTLTGRVLVPCWDVWTCTESLSRVLCGLYHCEYIFFLFFPLLFNLIKTQGISMTKEPFLREILFTSRPLNVSLRTFAHIKRWNYLGRSFDSVTVQKNS